MLCEIFNAPIHVESVSEWLNGLRYCWEEKKAKEAKKTGQPIGKLGIANLG